MDPLPGLHQTNILFINGRIKMIISNQSRYRLSLNNYSERLFPEPIGKCNFITASNRDLPVGDGNYFIPHRLNSAQWNYEGTVNSHEINREFFHHCLHFHPYD